MDGSDEGTFQAAGNDVLVSLILMMSVVMLVSSLSWIWLALFDPSPLRGTSTPYWAFVAGLYFGGSTVWSARFLFDRSPRLELSEAGVLNRTYWSAPVLLPWTEIVEIRARSTPGVREVVLRDEQAWLKEQPRSVRGWARIHTLIGVGTVPINLWALDARWRDVDHELETRLEHHELASLRASALGDGGSTARVPDATRGRGEARSSDRE